MSKLLVGTVCLLISYVEISEAIRCYNCNSANNSACLDGNLNGLKAVVPTVDCGTLPSIFKQDYFCRKITQTIFHGPNDASEVRVTRGCGWIRHKRECYKADNEGHLETVCQCFSDECNAASVLIGSTIIASALAAIIAANNT